MSEKLKIGTKVNTFFGKGIVVCNKERGYYEVYLDVPTWIYGKFSYRCNEKKKDVTKMKNKVSCKEKNIMTLKECEPCPKKEKCRKYLIVKHFGGKKAEES